MDECDEQCLACHGKVDDRWVACICREVEDMAGHCPVVLERVATAMNLRWVS